jgi:hypothetical protein
MSRFRIIILPLLLLFATAGVAQQPTSLTVTIAAAEHIANGCR